MKAIEIPEVMDYEALRVLHYEFKYNFGKLVKMFDLLVKRLQLEEDSTSESAVREALILLVFIYTGKVKLSKEEMEKQSTKLLHKIFSYKNSKEKFKKMVDKIVLIFIGVSTISFLYWILPFSIFFILGYIFISYVMAESIVEGKKKMALISFVFLLFYLFSGLMKSN